MANGRNDTMRWVGYVVGAIVVLLLLAWLLGWFGADESGVAGIEDEATVEEPAATGATTEGEASD